MVTTEGVMETNPEERPRIDRGIFAYPEIDDGVREVNKAIDAVKDLILKPYVVEVDDEGNE